MFLGRDFAVLTVSLETQGNGPSSVFFVLQQSQQIQHLQPKQQNNSVYYHSSQRNCENSKMDEEDEHSLSQFYYPEELETFEHYLFLLLHNWDMIKNHCT